MPRFALAALDASNMHRTLLEFPQQARDALERARARGSVTLPAACRHIVVIGMGGSAIGGDLLRSYLHALHRPTPRVVTVQRGYDLPSFVGPDDFVIASSYSGTTEETLSAFDQAVARTPHVLCLTSGGELALRARAHALPVIALPEGYAPRCALAYSFFPILAALATDANIGAEAARETERGIEETLTHLTKRAPALAATNLKNPAFALAKRLHGRIPVVYAPADGFDAVGLRWRNQFHENAKQLAFGNVLPEMNHNEIESWSHPRGAGKKFALLLLRDRGEHPRVARRFAALKELVGARAGAVEEVWSEGDSLLTRMFSLIQFGDRVSYFLALHNGVDPTAIPTIMKLKELMR